jgi:hypothetical protein
MPELPDERLSAELKRRATLARSSQDWARSDLASGVLGALQAQPAPVPSSRASRWLALAAVAVVLVLLVVALPSLNTLPGPGQPSASPSPGPLSVMTTADFASALAAGKLDGQTVLVDGRIVAHDGPPIFGGLCGASGPACMIGQLDGASPRITVTAQDVAVSTQEESSNQRPDTGWSWWKRFEPPIEGILVLSVDDQGTVEYLGRVMSREATTWSAGAVQSSLDVNGRALDEVVLVDAWLTGYEYAGPMSCPIPMMPSGPTASLPRLDGCGVGSWLADPPVAVNPNNVVAPSPALRVQTDAAQTYVDGRPVSMGSGDSFGPERAVFLVSRRLYGDGCMDPSTPCWNWAIVGRLSQPAPEVTPSVPTAPPTPHIVPSPSTSTSSTQVAGVGFTFSISASKSVYSVGEPIDVWSSRQADADVTVTCLVFSGVRLQQLDGPLNFSPGPAISICPGPRMLQIGVPVTGEFADVWNQTDPDPIAPYMHEGKLYLPPGRYRFTDRASFYPGDTLGGNFVELTASIDITVSSDKATSTPTSPTSSELSCGDNMRLVDTTGQVVGCSDAGVKDYHSQDPHVSIDPAQPSLLHVWWGQSYCTTSYDIQVSPGVSGLSGNPEYLVSVTTHSQTQDPNCVPDAHSADIQFSSPLMAENVALVVNGGSRVIDPTPCAPAADLVDGGDGVDIYDQAGLIASCSQVPADGDTASIRNVTDSSLAVRWTDRPCGVPIHLSFAVTGNGYELSRPGKCLVTAPMTYEIVIQVSQPIPAARLDISTLLH